MQSLAFSLTVWDLQASPCVRWLTGEFVSDVAPRPVTCEMSINHHQVPIYNNDQFNVYMIYIIYHIEFTSKYGCTMKDMYFLLILTYQEGLLANTFVLASTSIQLLRLGQPWARVQPPLHSATPGPSSVRRGSLMSLRPWFCAKISSRLKVRPWMNVQQALYLELIFFWFEVNSTPCFACINAAFLGFVAHISSDLFLIFLWKLWLSMWTIVEWHLPLYLLHVDYMIWLPYITYILHFPCL